MSIGTQPIIRTGWTVGSASAESDRDLFEVFIESGSFDSLKDVDDRRAFVIGRTGAGKSASLSQIHARQPTRALKISPQDFAFQYLTNTDMVSTLKKLGVNLSPFFKALWTHIIVVEILNRHYGIYSEADKQSAFQRIRTAHGANRARDSALSYLDDFGSDFWEPAHVRVKQISENFAGRIVSTSGEVGVGSSVVGIAVSAGGNDQEAEGTKVREEREIRERYQSVVARTLAPRMAEVTRIIDEVVLNNDRNPLFVLLDDLDREWSDDEIRIDLIRCLFDAVMELHLRVRNLKILVALRTNIFGQLGYEQSRFHQVEKIEDSTLILDWSRFELRQLIQSRLEKISRHYNLAPDLSLEAILPSDDDQHGDAFEWMLDRTLLRPRDIIVWMNEVLRSAAGRPSISWNDMHAIEKRVSARRLDSLRDEWVDPYLGIDQVLDCFSRQRSWMTLEDYLAIIDLEVAALLADERFVGRDWLYKLIGDVYEGNTSGRSYPFQNYEAITELLWSMTFIGITDTATLEPIFSIDEDARWLGGRAIDSSTYFVIHPAFQSGLETFGDARLRA